MGSDGAEAGCTRDALRGRLRRFNVFARAYFHPVASDYPCYAGRPGTAPGAVPVARRVGEEVLALPLYGALTLDDAGRLCDIVAHCLLEA